jgi:hypothetical protein
MFCILAPTFFMKADPVTIEQLDPCYATLELCNAAIPVVAHRIVPVVNTGMAFRCEREERPV